MITQGVRRIGQELDQTGYALTSYKELEIPQHELLAADLVAAVHNTDQFHDMSREGRTGMLMFREDAPLEMGRQLIRPVAEVLFGGNPEAMAGLGMYAVNHYEVGDFFNPHQDHFDGTVMIMTPLGRRRFDVYEKEPEDDVFKHISESFVLGPGSIMLLNGYKNLGHAAVCLEGPSLSVVADVPVPLRIN